MIRSITLIFLRNQYQGILHPQTIFCVPVCQSRRNTPLVTCRPVDNPSISSPFSSSEVTTSQKFSIRPEEQVVTVYLNYRHCHLVQWSRQHIVDTLQITMDTRYQKSRRLPPFLLKMVRLVNVLTCSTTYVPRTGYLSELCLYDPPVVPVGW